LLFLVAELLRGRFPQGDQITRDEMCRTYRAHGGIRSSYKILVGKPEGEKSVGDIGVNDKLIGQLEWSLNK
jgi:hypothetical protein